MTPSSAPPPTRRELVLAALASAAVFVVFAWPWVRDAAHAIPDAAARGNQGWGADARLIVWALAWDVHALVTQPLRLFDANIFHPAPGMLAGAENLLATALLVAPVQLASRNPVLAANVAAMATYPLAAVLMYALARTLGLPRLAAAVGAAALALGPLRVPGELQALQYPNWLLALVLLAAVAVERRPSRARVLALFGAVLLTAFSAYYVAAVAAVLLAVEVVLAAASAGRGAALRIAAAGGAALVLLAAVSAAHVRHVGGQLPDPAVIELTARFVHRALLDPSHPQVGMGWPVAALALAGLAAPLGGVPALRWWRWVALAAVGYTLAWGPHLEVGGLSLPLPYAALMHTPLRAVRNFGRFVVLGHVGLAGLAAEAAALVMAAAARAPRGRAVATLLGSVLLAAVLVPRGLALPREPRTPLPARAELPPAYRALATIERGPLLELPGPTLGLGNMLVQSDIMYRSTFHWLPLLNGHTGYPPWWYGAVAGEIARLPDPAALQALVDLAGLRWILVPRERIGPGALGEWESLPERVAGVVRRPEGVPDLLLEVRRTPRRPWAEALARGAAAPGRTILGTPRAPLPADAARGAVSVLAAPASAAAAARLTLELAVENRGTADWPALAPADDPGTHLVALAPTWLPADGGAPVPADPLRLPRDVAAGERLVFPASVTAPAHPGRWTLALALEQAAGARFEETAPARVPIEVRPEP